MLGFPDGGASCLPKPAFALPLYRVGEVWYIDLPTNQGRVRRSTGTTDKKAAQEYHDTFKNQLWREAKLGEKPAVTWGAAVDKWLSVKPRGMPDRYRIAAFDLDPTISLPLPTKKLEEILPTTSPGSWNRSLSLVQAIHGCVGISVSPIERRTEAPGRTRWLTAEEWLRLRKVLEMESPLLRQAAQFTLATGLRENNVLELTWDQIDLQRRVAWLHADQVKTLVSLGVPLNDDACAVLAERRGIHRRWVFGNPDYPLSKASNRAWYSAVRKARLRGFRWHDLRHTWASWAVMSGVRLEEVQRLGGWKTAQMVQRYAHLSSEHLAEASAKIKPVSARRNVSKRGKSGHKNATKGG